MELEGGGDKIIYRELSYVIIGIVFEVFNDLGFGYQEKVYQNALAAAFENKNLKFKSQCPYTVCYKGNTIGKYFIDYIVEDRIVIEIKQGDYFLKKIF